MFLKITNSGSHTYAQIVQAYRDENGKTRQKVILSLGRVDTQGGLVDHIITGLLQAREISQGNKLSEHAHRVAKE